MKILPDIMSQNGARPHRIDPGFRPFITDDGGDVAGCKNEWMRGRLECSLHRHEAVLIPIKPGAGNPIRRRHRRNKETGVELMMASVLKLQSGFFHSCHGMPAMDRSANAGQGFENQPRSAGRHFRYETGPSGEDGNIRQASGGVMPSLRQGKSELASRRTAANNRDALRVAVFGQARKL